MVPPRVAASPLTRPVFFVDGRSGAAIADDPHIRNVAGNNTLDGVRTDWNTGWRSGSLSGSIAGNIKNINIQSDSGKLTIAGGPIYNTSDPEAIGFWFCGAGDGQIDSQMTMCSTNPSFNLVKKGASTWTLDNIANDYTGITTVEEGLLLVNGGFAAGDGSSPAGNVGSAGLSWAARAV